MAFVIDNILSTDLFCIPFPELDLLITVFLLITVLCSTFLSPLFSTGKLNLEDNTLLKSDNIFSLLFWEFSNIVTNEFILLFISDNVACFFILSDIFFNISFKDLLFFKLETLSSDNNFFISIIFFSKAL